MATDDIDEQGVNASEAPDEWDDFRGEAGEPIDIEALTQLDLSEIPEDARVWVMDNYFPEASLRRDGKF